MLVAIGDELGKILHVEQELLSSEDKRVAKILVEINIHKALLEELIIE